MREPLKITKLEAALCQLETAIELFFHYGDAVSIHTLTAAANGILRDLGKERQVTSIEDLLLEVFRPEYRKEARKTIREAQNFFKHADSEPDKILTFSAHQAVFFLFDACNMYRKLTETTSTKITLYTFWFYKKNPDLLAKVPENKLYLEVLTNAYAIDPEERIEMWEVVFPDSRRV